MAAMKMSEIKREVRQQAKELFAKTYSKTGGDLAATYATIDQESRKLNITAETPAKVKKSMIYDEATKIAERNILNNYMKAASYEYNYETHQWEREKKA